MLQYRPKTVIDLALYLTKTVIDLALLLTNSVIDLGLFYSKLSDFQQKNYLQHLLEK